MALAQLIAKGIGQKIANKWKDERAQLDSLISELTPEARDKFYKKWEENKKSVAIGYLFWMAGGTHYIYTKKYVKQVLFWGTIGGIFLWYILDLFLMYFVVDTYNRELGFQLIGDFFEEGAESEEDSHKATESQIPQSQNHIFSNSEQFSHLH